MFSSINIEVTLFVTIKFSPSLEESFLFPFLGMEVFGIFRNFDSYTFFDVQEELGIEKVKDFE